jgi:hypothetical protein
MFSTFVIPSRSSKRPGERGMIEKKKDRPQGAGLLDYLKEAFLYRWNLLFFLGGTAAAAISPAPDVFVPLVAAGELFYLVGLTAVPRFRAAIDAKVHSQRKGPLVTEPSPAETQRAFGDLLAGLAQPKRERFLRLRDRCIYMQRIARGVRGRSRPEAGEGADDIRGPALDRLLWVFLRLLYAQQAIERFLATTDVNAMQKQLEDGRRHEESMKNGGDERILRSLRDSIATTELRLDNYRKAERNAEFLAVETERIEGKIQAIGEMAVSHQDPDFISSQVDSVTESMSHTEAAIRELNQITGLTDQIEGTPEILQADLPTRVPE